MSTPIQLSFLDPAQNRDWNDIRGWLLPEAAECLFKHAQTARAAGDFVEIGSFAGKSTICLLTALKDRTDQGERIDFTAIDLRFQPDFLSNIRTFGFEDRVRMISGPSLDAVESWSKPISFLYIDGHHGKGYALADLLLWDIHLGEGAILALDDTAGFMIGPNLQIQAAVRSGAYELLEEAGGISFLKKRKPLLPIGENPMSDGALLAHLHVISAGLGAMDPAFRAPRLPKQPMPPAELLDRALNTSILELFRTASAKLRRRSGPAQAGGAGSAPRMPQFVESSKVKLDRLIRECPEKPGLSPTFNYLNACYALRTGSFNEALGLLVPLAEAPADEMLHHYDLPIAAMSRLRLAQCHDLNGDRNSARDLFGDVAADDSLPEEVRAHAAAQVDRAYEVPVVAENLLLRQYNLALYRFKRSVFGGSE